MATAASQPQTSPKRPGRKPGRTHTARVDFRLPPAAHEKIKKAALLNGQSLSEFAASVLVREADALLARQQTVELSERDWAQFSALMRNPPAPTAAATRQAQRYADGTVDGETFTLPADWETLREGETADSGF